MFTAQRPFPNETTDRLRIDVRGDVLLPEDEGYDEARTVWNAMIDRYPAVIVRALGAADVMTAVRFAREHELEIAVKGGGHNVAGNAVCDDGLVIDLSRMKSVRVDSERRTARVEPGATLHDFDLEAQAHGLVAPGGFVSTTGVAGLTLGGGFGYLSRAFGLTIDSLRSVDLVTAEGELVRASADENPDLFWAIRGGGGNFGVVTSFEFALHELDPIVLAGPVAWAFEDAPAVLRALAAAMREAPDEVSSLVAIRHAPPAPFLPEEVHGELALIVALIYAGDPEAGQDALAPLRAIGEPIADAVEPRPFVAFQSLFDQANTPGARNYWKSHYLTELSDDAIDAICAQAERIPSAESAIGLLSLGGAIRDVPADATAYPHRDAPWVLNVPARWREPEDDERHIEWVRRTFDATEPYSTGGVYVNFISAGEGEERLRDAYEETYNRLAEVKSTWDPENVFHLNQNIKPGTDHTQPAA